MTQSALLGSGVLASILLLAPSTLAQGASLFYDDPADDRASQASPPAPAAQAPGSTPPPSGSDATSPSVLRLGEAGELVFDGSIELGGQKTWYSGNAASDSGFSVDLGLDYFVYRGLSIGAELELTSSDAKGYEPTSGATIEDSTTVVGAGARVGYAVPLGDRFSLWPRAELFYDSKSETESINGVSSTAGASGVHHFLFTGYLPLVYSPVPHFFIGFGPSANVPFGGAQEDSKRFYAPWSLGAGLVVGGFIGGGDAATQARPSQTAASAPPVQRFGSEGTFVLSNDLEASGFHYEDSAYPQSSTTFTVQPSFDYFFSQNLSIGVAPSFSTSTENTVDSSGDAYSTSVTTFGVGVRMGVNVPLGDEASLWVRGALGFSTSSYSETNTDFPSSWESDAAWGSLSAPILFHVVPHAFFGLGPTLYHEFSRTSGQGIIDPEATTLGAGFIAGGWL